MHKFVREFGKNNSVIIGTIHNYPESFNQVQIIMRKEKYDYYLIELNRDNFNFIKRNRVYFSEFYPVITGVIEKKIVLIDTSPEVSLKNYNNNKGNYDLFEKYISYKYNKLYYLYINYIFKKHKDESNIALLKSFYVDHHFTKIFIKERELNMINMIKQYSEYKICVIVGRNHFDIILNQVNK